MGSRFGSGRESEEFERLLEDPSAPHDPAYDELLKLVGALHSIEQPSPRPEFSASLRASLLAEADTALLVQPRPTRSPAAPSRTRRFRLAVAGLALVGGVGSVGALAQAAVPGDLLYPIKRTIESGRSVFTFGDEASGRQLLAYATERLDEAAELAERSDADPADSETALADFSEQARGGANDLLAAYSAGADDEAIADLKSFAATSLDSLAALAHSTPAEADDELRTAVETVLDIDRLADEACKKCGGPGIVEIPAVLAGKLNRAESSLDASTAGHKPGRKHRFTPPGTVGTTTATAAPTSTSTFMPTQQPTLAPPTTTQQPTVGNTPTTKATVSVTPSLPTVTLPTISVTSVLPTLPTILPSVTAIIPSITSALPTVLPSEITTILPSVSLPVITGLPDERPNARPSPEAG